MAEEIVTCTATKLASKAAESAYNLLKQQISYVFKYQSYINNLKNQVEDLRNKRETVDKPVESAERQGEEIYEAVKKWLSDVDEFTERVAKAIIGDEDKANEGRCLKLKSCSNLIRRYKLGKEAAKAAVTGANLLGKGNFRSFSYRPALQRTESMYVRGYEAFDSREQVLQEILDTLKDSNFHMVGVHGMGGVGKTTLVNKVAWQVKEDRIFHEVAIAEVTQTPDYKKIQEKLASDLGLEFWQESEYQRASQLRSRIKKEKSLLIILDNIWTKLDLDAIGIPFGDAEKERKDDKIRPCTILLTSRNRDLLSKDMKTQKNIFVCPLSKDDSWNLFRKIVGDSAESSDFHPLADEFVTKCAGLPIAISTIANTLKNEGLHFWKDALAQLKRSNPRHIPDMEESVYSTIELSYNFLKIEEAKSLFCLCALTDAGSSMSTGNLLKYCMGLNLFGDVYTLEEGRNRLHRLIDYLKASCLLLDGGNDHAVKMHDIIHDVAVSIAATEKFMFNIQHVIGLKEVLGEKIPKDSTAISLPYRDIYGKLPQRLEFPKLKLFFLFMNNHSLQIPDVIFEEMKELKVLNLTGFLFLSLPSSLSCLKNLQTLCLHDCLLDDLRILGKLSKLEILSFLRSDIELLPAEIGQLTQLKLLDLSNCINLKYIAPHVISGLSQLEELYMGNCLVHWEAEGVDNEGRRNASLEELKQLSNLTTLHLHVQDARVMPQYFFFKKLKSYHLFIGDKWKWSDKYCSSTSRTFKLKISDNVYLGHGIKSLLKMTEDLFLEEMNGVRYVVYELNVDGFPHLKHLHVEDGQDILYIINSVALKVAFPKLESLILCNLIKLEKICHGQLNAVSFSKLRIIKIEKCDRLEYLFASFMAKNLMQLQEIEVTYCKNLKELFVEESDDDGDEIERNDKMEFNQLCSLTLQCLPKFIKIDSNMAVVFPRLENLKLCSINVENTWLDRPLSIFSYSQCLKSLSIEECHGLNYLFSSAMVKRLNELQKLVIRNCKSMEVIVDSKGVQGEETIIYMSFPKLFYMKLELLPKLTNFGIGNLIEFPSLKELHIEGCSNLKTFLCKSFHLDTVREEEEKVNLENYFMNINPLFDEKVAFPSLEEMVLSHLDNLQLIWHNQKLHAKSFCKLKEVRVEFCGKLLTIVPSNTQGNLTFHYLKRLTIVGCQSMKSLFPVSTAIGLVQLEHLDISLCGLEIIVSEEEVKGAPTFLFPQLKSIYLSHLKELKYFYPRLHTIEWPMLSTLVVVDCKKIKVHDFEFSSFQERDKEREPAIFYLEKVIPNLEMLSFGADDFGLAFLHSNLAESFGKLKWLLLSDFDDESGSSLVNFLKKLFFLESLYLMDNSFRELFPCKQGHRWKQDFQGDAFLPNLQNLYVCECHCLTILMPSTTSFKNLKYIFAFNCNGLDKVLSCEAAKTLVNLTTMDIRGCKLVTGVVANDGDKEEEIVFGQLRTLQLSRLSSLTCFCSANYSFKFPCLEQVTVTQCPNFNIFSPGVLSTPMLKKIQLTEGYDDQEYFWKDDLNSTIQQIFTNMVGYRNFEHLTLSEFPNVKEKIWNGQLSNNFFGNLKSLVVDKFLDILTGIPSNVLCYFKNLELLDVESCESLEQVFHLEENHQEISGLQKLKSLKIDNCNSLRCIFTPSILLGLVQLQEIEVKNCALIEEIIKKEEEKDGVSDKIIIPQLNSVMLESLPSLTSFYSGRNILECPPLETIIIKDCQKVQMKEFSSHLASCFTEKVELPPSGSSSCFQNLTILVIGGFDHLKYLLPSSMSKSFFKLKKLEIINCMFMERVIDEDEGRTRTMLFPKLYQLELRDLPKLTTFCNSTASFVEMSSVSRLWINNCPGIQTFISSSIYSDMTSLSKEPKGMTAKEDSTHMLSLFDKKVRLPSLEILHITYANQLVKLWDNQVSLDSFGNLVRVTVRFCKRLVSVFPSNMLGSHQKLEFLEVQNCDSVEEIFEVLEKSSGMVEEIVAEETILRFVFSKLTQLNLQMLPSLKSFYPEIHVSEWPDLEVLKVHGCDNVKIFASELLSIRGSDGDSQQTLFFVYKDAFSSLEELELCEMPRLSHLWRGNFQPGNAFQNLETLKVSECDSLENSCFSMMSLQNLETLQVSKCDGLRYLLTPSKAKTLDRLKRMNVSDCKLMVEIITHLGDEVVENSIVFGKLDCLELHCLSSLKSFCGGDYSFEFPFLEKVIVRKCLVMETFCHGVLSTPKLQRLQMTDGGEDAVEEFWEGNLNSTIQYLFKNMSVQYSKED